MNTFLWKTKSDDPFCSIGLVVSGSDIRVRVHAVATLSVECKPR